MFLCSSALEIDPLECLLIHAMSCQNFASYTTINATKVTDVPIALKYLI